MAESQKGASSVPESMKKSPVLVDDNGQDFFDAWKSTVGGKDVLNLNTEAVTRERKKAFDFGKLDDLELDAEFGKMASFKMDMSDLDFSSPQKKTEKSKERPGKETTPKKLEGRRDHFSFSFDFNELDAFDLDTNLLKREKKPRKSAESEMLDIFENDFKNSPKLGGMNCSSSKDLISSKVDTSNSRACASPADLEQCDVPHESPTSQQKQVTTAQGGKNETDHAEDKRGFQGEHPLTEGSKRPSAENLLQDFSVQSRDYSPKETIQQLQTAGPSSAIVDTNLGVEKDDISMRAKDPSQSGTYSPVKALDSKCLTKLCIESVITDNEPEKHQGDKRNVAHASVVFHEPPKMQKDVEDDSVGPVLHKTLPGMRRNEDKQRSSSKVLQSSLHGDSKSEQFTAMSHGSNGLQLLPQNKSQATGSRLTSSTTPNQLYAICNKKMETMNLHSANKKSEHSRDDEKGGNHDGGLLKSFNQNPKVGSMAAVIDKNHKDSNTLHGIQRPVSNTETTSITRVASAENCGVSLPNADKHCGLSNRSISSGIHRSVSNTETISITRVASAENCGVSLPNADKQCGLSNRNISRITKSNKSLSNFAMRETKSVGNSKGNMAQHLKASPVAAHSVTMEKCAAFSPPLKRKSIEGSHLDLLTSNSSKRILESSGERRKSLPISPGINGQVGPESENIGGLQEDTYLDQQNSWVDVHVEGTVMDLEIPISIENDGNIEKAEACTKDLENICNMLRRKHEEAKELLLRAIINNNSLLMLDHPMYEGKILELQRFAANLLLKKCDT